MRRYHPKTGELFLPHRYGDGQYRVADPALGNQSKLAKNQIPVPSLDELAAYVRRGFHVRMRGVDSGQTNLIRPEEIELSSGAASDGTAAVLSVEARSKAPSISHAPVAPAPAMAKRAAIPTAGHLPRHGRIACARCFEGQDVSWGTTTAERNGWALTNNPMAWGSETPEVLVLGFSKGGNQNAEILTRPHDDVAFRGGRPAVALILDTLGLKKPEESIDRMIADRDGRFGFGSLVRCSVKKWDGKEWLMSGKDIMASCLRDDRMGEVISNCIRQFLAALPATVRLVIMMGNDHKYIDGCYAAIRELRPRLNRINAVSYADGDVVFTHTVHFKAQGRIVPDWANGTPGSASRPEADQPLKRELAKEAVGFARKGGP